MRNTRRRKRLQSRDAATGMGAAKSRATMKTSLLTACLLSLCLTACGVDDAELAYDDAAATDEALSTKGRFETYVGRDGKHRFQLVAGNNEKVLASQPYATLEGAQKGIESVKANGTDASRFLLREAADGSWYFVVVAGNGEIIAMSEMYVSQYNATRGMTTVASVVKATLETRPAVSEAKFETFRGLDGKYYFHVRAQNGAIVLQSQGYTTRASATNGIESVQTNGGTATRYSVLAAADGQFYFVLKAANGQVIARSETFPSLYNAQRSVADCVELLTVALPRG
jgi:uncharacterized protein